MTSVFQNHYTDKKYLFRNLSNNEGLKKSHITFFKIKIMFLVENILGFVKSMVTDEDVIIQ